MDHIYFDPPIIYEITPNGPIHDMRCPVGRAQERYAAFIEITLAVETRRFGAAMVGCPEDMIAYTYAMASIRMDNVLALKHKMRAEILELLDEKEKRDQAEASKLEVVIMRTRSKKKL